MEANEMRCLTLLNRSGDITITWDSQNDEKIKELVKKKMAEGYTFFTMRKVVIDAIQIKRKVGTKGVDTITSLIIDDDTFEKMVEGLDDRDLADVLRLQSGKLAKRREQSKELIAQKRAKTPEEVIEAKQCMAVRPVLGG
jgi:septum formation inhibitor MinC